MRSRFLVPLLGAFAALFITSALSVPARADDNGLLAVKICGPTTATGTQCLIPNPDGTFSVTVSGSGDASAANQLSQITQETKTGTGIGAPADNTCATDAGSCGLIAQIKRLLAAFTSLNSKIDTLNTTASSSLSAGTAYVGDVGQHGTWTMQAGTGTSCPNVLPISQTTSTDLRTSSGKMYICSIVLIIPDAETASLVEGTGTVCATGIAAVIGGTTAANGIAPGANGGFSAIGGFPWLQTQTSNDHLCLLQSGSGRIAGVITYNDH